MSQHHPEKIILRTKNLTRCFGSLTAVNNLNIEVYKNEIFGLVGPNGSGKSTLLRMLTTLLPPTSGDAFIDGISIIKQTRKVRTRIGYVPQQLSVDGALTGYENLLFFTRLCNIPYKIRKARISEGLKWMRLENVAHRQAKNYSGGMMRRLEILQAMLHWPKVLFLDEPSTGLDPLARDIVWQHLKTTQKNLDTTIFLTTQDMEEVEKLCDRVAIMSFGKVLAVGTPIELKKSVNRRNYKHISMEDVFMYYAKAALQ